MRRLAALVLASLAVQAVAPWSSAVAATTAVQRTGDPEKGKIVLFGCGPTAYAKRTGSGSATRFETTQGTGAVRGRSYTTTHSPIADGSTGTAYRGVAVGVLLGFVEGWLPERCFHLVVPSATVTCASRIWDDAEGTRDSATSVSLGEVVYPAETASPGDNAYVYTHRPGIEGYVARRCLRSGSPVMHRAPGFALPGASPTPH